MPEESESPHWLTFPLGAVREVFAVITQGRAKRVNGAQRVTTYTVDVSTGSATGPWTPVDNGKVFDGNWKSKTNAWVTNKFAAPVAAKWVRISPKTWGKKLAMRAGLELKPLHTPRTLCCDKRCGDQCGEDYTVFDQQGTW